MHCPDLDFLPICFVIILVVSLATSFTIAVCDSDIAPWFPSISDTATNSPESNIFGQLVNIASFIGLLLVYVRYLQVKHDVEHLNGNRATLILNRWSLFFGLLAILGGSIVANFPETQVPVVHIIGASIMFVLGNIYAWIQVLISYHMKQLGLINLCICLTRFMLSVTSTCSLVVSVIMWTDAGHKWSGNNLIWNSGDPGYNEHVIGDAFEWLALFSLVGIFVTFIKEFCKIKLQINLVNSSGYYEPIVV